MRNPWDRFLPIFTAALLVLCFVRFGLWLPGYLIRPWYADHDVFAAMAQGWDSGLKPYRDLLGNNFPGTIYLFWCVGKTCGWGNVTAFYMVDAALLLTLGGMILLWSRARFGRALPGVVALLAVTTYYFKLDYTMTAQRDWHGPVLVALGLLAAQTWPKRGGRWLAALGFSAGMIVRPQVILLLPAVLMAVTEVNRLAGESIARTIRSAAVWLVVVGLLVLAWFLPLLREGLIGDFVNGLRLVLDSNSYSKTSLGSIGRSLYNDLRDVRIITVIATLAVMARTFEPGPGRALTRTWLVALVGVLFYYPLSPGGQVYLYHAFWLVWSICLAIPTGLILTSVELPLGFVYVLVMLNLAMPAWPRFAQHGEFRRSITALRERRPAGHTPNGYLTYDPYGVYQYPPWDDYRATLDYLRNKTAPDARVANLLRGVAIAGPTARLSALPAESTAWLSVVKASDEARFARALEESGDSVVVWAPGVNAMFNQPLPLMEEVVRRLYRPDARFGTIEIWRRIPRQ